jgi:hypothetical protein
MEGSINLLQDRNQCWALVNTVMSILGFLRSAECLDQPSEEACHEDYHEELHSMELVSGSVKTH